ncbi:hypothetical protein BVI1335_970010 [Burkholderia vietnamiensis]|nr:hypothetical protein BVI1335_970010 [Burkholderia vietnamiensis]
MLAASAKSASIDINSDVEVKHGNSSGEKCGRGTRPKPARAGRSQRAQCGGRASRDPGKGAARAAAQDVRAGVDEYPERRNRCRFCARG